MRKKRERKPIARFEIPDLRWTFKTFNEIRFINNTFPSSFICCMNFTLEVIAFNIDSCILAEEAGAHRIELCDNAGEGGTTPSSGFIESARAAVSLQLFPIIRPRGGDFLYSDAEFEIMKKDILVCKSIGCDGIVTGILQADGRIDKKRISQLVTLAYPMSVTFHRAFDRALNAADALEDVIETGCERILTSGQVPLAENGTGLIAELIKKAEQRIIIMPGSGIRANNILSIAQQTGATEFHSSARIFTESNMNFHNERMNEKLQSVCLDVVEVKAMIFALSEQ